MRIAPPCGPGRAPLCRRLRALCLVQAAGRRRREPALRRAEAGGRRRPRALQSVRGEGPWPPVAASESDCTPTTKAPTPTRHSGFREAPRRPWVPPAAAGRLRHHCGLWAARRPRTRPRRPAPPSRDRRILLPCGSCAEDAPVGSGRRTDSTELLKPLKGQVSAEVQFQINISRWFT